MTCYIQYQIKLAKVHGRRRNGWQRRQRSGGGWSGASNSTTGPGYHRLIRRVPAAGGTEGGTPEGITDASAPQAADDSNFFKREAD